MDVYIRQLRKKIDEGSPVKLLRTVRGVGYSINEGGRVTASRVHPVAADLALRGAARRGFCLLQRLYLLGDFTLTLFARSTQALDRRAQQIASTFSLIFPPAGAVMWGLRFKPATHRN